MAFSRLHADTTLVVLISGLSYVILFGGCPDAQVPFRLLALQRRCPGDAWDLDVPVPTCWCRRCRWSADRRGKIPSHFGDGVVGPIGCLSLVACHGCVLGDLAGCRIQCRDEPRSRRAITAMGRGAQHHHGSRLLRHRRLDDCRRSSAIVVRRVVGLRRYRFYYFGLAWYQ